VMTNSTSARCTVCGTNLPLDELSSCMTCDHLTCMHCNPSCLCELLGEAMDLGFTEQAMVSMWKAGAEG
jgi:hypothetical protein